MVQWQHGQKKKAEKTNSAYETQEIIHKRIKMTSRLYKCGCVTWEV